jgi:creatinine amidohydrolase
MERRYERLTPDEIAAAKDDAPVAYVPLGALEWHSWHLPTGLDGIKARELCLRVAEAAGGVVLPALYQGTGGEHADYETSLMVEADVLEPVLESRFRRLADLGYEVVVALTGHYAAEQVALVTEVAERVEAATETTVLALPEHEAYPGERRADHAGKWETSILWALEPDLVQPARFDDHPEDRHRGVYVTDPEEASPELGAETVDVIVATLAERVRDALA